MTEATSKNRPLAIDCYPKALDSQHLVVQARTHYVQQTWRCRSCAA